MYKRYRTPSQHSLDFTPRETEVHNLILKGYSTQRIAETFGVSLKTAKRYRWRVLAKQRKGGGPAQPRPLFNETEERIIALTHLGLSNEQIAERLTMARGTIGCYVWRICQKKGVRKKREI